MSFCTDGLLCRYPDDQDRYSLLLSHEKDRTNKREIKELDPPQTSCARRTTSGKDNPASAMDNPIGNPLDPPKDFQPQLAVVGN